MVVGGVWINITIGAHQKSLIQFSGLQVLFAVAWRIRVLL